MYEKAKAGYIKYGTKLLRRGHVPRKQETTEIGRYRYGRIYPTHPHRMHKIEEVTPRVRKKRFEKRETVPWVRGKRRVVKREITPYVKGKKKETHEKNGKQKVHEEPYVQRKAKNRRRTKSYVDAFNSDMDKLFASM